MKEEAAMPRKFVEVFDRFGNPVDDDIVPDGGRVRVSMMARDGLSPLQRAIAEDKAARRFDDSAARNQPGPVYCDAAGRERKAEAYRQMCDELVNAWRTPSAPLPAAGAGDDATPARPVYDAAERRRIKAAAYQQMVDEMTSAWKGPAR